MERGHHPNVVRTWAVDRIRQSQPPVNPIPTPAAPRKDRKPTIKPAPKPKEA